MNHKFSSIFLIKGLFTVLYVFFSTPNLAAQPQNGEFISMKTSFKDNKDPQNSFDEEAQNNILIDLEKNMNHGIFVFEDPRIPNNVLSYEVLEFEDKAEKNDLIAYIFNCKPLHRDSLTKIQIAVYYDKEGNMNLMIYDTSSSQVFHDLIRQD